MTLANQPPRINLANGGVVSQGSCKRKDVEPHPHDEIARVLKVTSGRVGGPDGAAARIGINRTTLLSRVKQFGIDPRIHRALYKGYVLV